MLSTIVNNIVEPESGVTMLNSIAEPESGVTMLNSDNCEQCGHVGSKTLFHSVVISLNRLIIFCCAGVICMSLDCHGPGRAQNCAGKIWQVVCVPDMPGVQLFILVYNCSYWCTTVHIGVQLFILVHNCSYWCTNQCKKSHFIVYSHTFSLKTAHNPCNLNFCPVHINCTFHTGLAGKTLRFVTKVKYYVLLDKFSNKNYFISKIDFRNKTLSTKNVHFYQYFVDKVSMLSLYSHRP